MREVSEEEEDILKMSTKRSKDSHEVKSSPKGGVGSTSIRSDEARKSYRDTVMGDMGQSQETQEGDDDEGNTLNDDVIEEGDKVMWFGMEMTREEKIAKQRPWRTV